MGDLLTRQSKNTVDVKVKCSVCRGRPHLELVKCLASSSPAGNVNRVNFNKHNIAASHLSPESLFRYYEHIV